MFCEESNGIVFVTPSATFAAQNLFGNLGRDFHASDSAVTWIGGIGNAIMCSLGAAIGGWLCNRMDRRVLFVSTGVVAAVATLGMAFGSRTAVVFLVGVCVYNLLAGVNYAGSVIVGDTNGRYFEPSAERNFLVGMTANARF